MKVEMIRDRNFRGNHVAAGQVIDMDGQTAQWFIAQGWARVHADAPAMTPTEADAALPAPKKGRRAIR